jgi:hypothetical protein
VLIMHGFASMADAETFLAGTELRAAMPGDFRAENSDVDLNPGLVGGVGHHPRRDQAGPVAERAVPGLQRPFAAQGLEMRAHNLREERRLRVAPRSGRVAAF